MILFSIFLFLISLLITIFAVQKSKNGGFYQDVFALFPLGIYVWGDGLILGVFWMFSSILFIFLSEINIIRYLLLFFAFRSFYEVVYWLVHQSNKKDYQPPIFRNISFLSANESAILYQLAHTCLLILFVFFLIYSFV